APAGGGREGGGGGGEAARQAVGRPFWPGWGGGCVRRLGCCGRPRLRGRVLGRRFLSLVSSHLSVLPLPGELSEMRGMKPRTTDTNYTLVSCVSPKSSGRTTTAPAGAPALCRAAAEEQCRRRPTHPERFRLEKSGARRPSPGSNGGRGPPSEW